MMVTTQISGTIPSAAIASTAVTADTAAFMQALRQEIGAAAFFPQSIVGIEATASPEVPTTELTEQLGQLLENLIGGSGEEKAELLGAISELLEKGTEESGEDENSVESALLQIVGQMTEQTKQAPTAEISVRTAESAVIPTAESTFLQAASTARQTEIITAVIPTAVGTEQKAAQTVYGGEAEAPQKTEQTETTESEKQLPLFAKSVAVQTAEPQAQHAEIQSAEAVSPVKETKTTETEDLHTETTAVQTQTVQTVKTNAELQPKAQKILDTLLQYAKENLGLSKASLTAETTEEAQQPVFVRTVFVAAAEIKRQSVSDELSQLLSGFTAAAAEKQTAASSTATVPQTETKAQTETAVKLPEELMNALASPTILQTAVSGETTVQTPLPAQISEQIIAHLQTSENGKASFTMTLNPEALGKIEVKISTEEGRVSVEITAHSRQTQNILSERIDGLREALKQSGVELEKYQVVYSPEETQTQHQSYDGSSKNPYNQRQKSSENDGEQDGEFAQLLASL